MQEMKVYAGENITRACQKLAAKAPAWMEFNGVRVEARGGETSGDLEAEWRRGMDAASAEHERKRREFEATPEGQRKVAEAKRAAEDEKRLRSALHSRVVMVCAVSADDLETPTRKSCGLCHGEWPIDTDEEHAERCPARPRPLPESQR